MDQAKLVELVTDAFKTDTTATFSGQIEKAYEITKVQASRCFSYGTELSAHWAICTDLATKYGEVQCSQSKI